MHPVLITVGTYWDPVEARLARIHLEAAGIRSVLQNEHSVTMNWLEFANASKGVQLQVDPADVEEAINELERKSPDSDEIGDEWEAGSSEINDEEDQHFVEGVDLAEDAYPQETAKDSAPLNLREQRIERAYLTAVFGLVFLPLEFYSTYLWGVSLISDEPIRPMMRTLERQAIVFNVLVLLMYFLFALQSSQYGIDPASSMYDSFFA